MLTTNEKNQIYKHIKFVLIIKIFIMLFIDLILLQYTGLYYIYRLKLNFRLDYVRFY